MLCAHVSVLCVSHAVAEVDFFVVEKRIVDPHSDTILYNNIAHTHTCSICFICHMVRMCVCFIKVILISVWMELVGFVPCHDGGVALCIVSYRLLCHLFLSLSSFSHARLCLVMLEICLFHAEPVHKNIIQYCVTYTASHSTLNSALLDAPYFAVSSALALLLSPLLLRTF